MPQFVDPSNGNVSFISAVALANPAANGIDLNNMSAVYVDSSGNRWVSNGSTLILQNSASGAIPYEISVAQNNLFVGDGVGETVTTGEHLVGFGSNGTMSSVTEAIDCTAFGDAAFANLQTGVGGCAFGRLSCSTMTVAGNNTGFGDSTLRATTSGGGNTAVGYVSTQTNTTGQLNTAIGLSSLRNSVGGSRNTALGGSALYTLSTLGDDNTAVGFQAAYSYNGSNICAVGRNSLFFATGVQNTAIGFQAGQLLTTGTGNTFIGYRAGDAGQLVTASNSIAIGANTATTKNGQCVIGDATIVETVLRGYVKSTVYTVGTLETAANAGAGARAFVSDANATTFASIVAGGGANGVPVYSDGTNWRIG